jgi:hypothetical protein
MERKEMDFVYVNSSNLAAVGYEELAGTLEITFHGGSHYRYFDVPPSVHTGLMNANSHGQYFDRVIKNGTYRYIRLA